MDTILLEISCELMLMMAISCCVYSYGMKSGSESLYGVCTLLFYECKVVKLNWCVLVAYLGSLVQCLWRKTVSEPAILARAGGTRLGETCRDSYSHPTRGSRSGEHNWV